MEQQFISIGKILKTKGFDGTMLVSFSYPMLKRDLKAVFTKKGDIHIPILIEKIDLKDEIGRAHV